MFVAFRDDEKFGGYEIEVTTEGEEAGIEGALRLSTLECEPVVVVGVSKNAAQSPRKAGKVSVRGLRDRNSGYDNDYVRIRLEDIEVNHIPRRESTRGIKECSCAVESMYDIVDCTTMLQSSLGHKPTL